MQRITAIVVEPQPIFLRGLEHDLAEAKDIRIVGTTTKGKRGLELIQTLKPNVAVVAMKLRDLSGLGILECLVDQPHDTSILILTEESHEDVICECMVAGAAGYLLKWDLHDLPEAIRAVHRGEIVMCPTSLTGFVHAVRTRMSMDVTEVVQNGKTPLLSLREREVLQLIADGHRQPEIAERLTLAPNTVKSHRQNIYKKLRVKTQAAAVQEAATRGLINRRGVSSTSR